MTESRRAVGGANLSWDEFWAEAKRGRDAMEITACNCIGPQRGESACPCVLRQRQRQYFNTTAESSQQLAAYEQTASEQNVVVLGIFQSAKRPLSPSQVAGLYPPSKSPRGTTKPPLTSIRRAISTLTKAGALVKTEVKRKGLYGRSEFVWTLPEVPHG